MALTISVKDFGPICEGTVELKPLTVFVGPSNTGKSYLATLIYALMYGMTPGMIPTYLSSAPDLEPTDAAELKDAIANWLGELAGAKGEVYTVQFSEFPSIVRAYTAESICNALQEAAEQIAGDLLRIHGKADEWRRRGSGAAQLQADFAQDDPLLKGSFAEMDPSGQIGFSHSYRLAGAEVELPADLIESLREETAGSVLAENFPGAAVTSFRRQLGSGLLEYLLQDFPEGSYYLPAARSGIILGRREIASTLLRQGSDSNLPGIVEDYFGEMLSTRWGMAKGKLPRKLQGAIDFLEREVAGGKINFEESELYYPAYPEIFYETAAGRFPLRQTSSMVSELAPVILFLKYLVRPGDLLILEEPEAHLHPASQRRMAQGIVRLVNAGVRVLITTHSDYFVGQLNNLLRISYASARWLKREGFARADCLKATEVAAYHFQGDAVDGGSRVIPLPITPGFGIDAPDFLAVSESLYEEAISVQRIRVPQDG